MRINNKQTKKSVLTRFLGSLLLHGRSWLWEAGGFKKHTNSTTWHFPSGLLYLFSLVLGSVVCWSLNFFPGNFPSQSEQSHSRLCAFHYTDSIQWPLEIGIQNQASLTPCGTILKGHSRPRDPHRIDESSSSSASQHNVLCWILQG